MKVINIVDSVSKVNFGIWNAAIATAHILKNQYDIASEIWFPDIIENNVDENLFNGCLPRQIGTFNPIQILKNEKSIIVSHGCWQMPTRLAYKLRRKGYPWMYVPHGMLEPWSLQQKALQKKIYYKLIENPLTQNANVIRAVGSPEYNNLKKVYQNVTLIPNGVEEVNVSIEKSYSPIRFLFMARLHHKKGIIPLVKAWKNSSISNTNQFHLTIAGPDDGNLMELLHEIKGTSNITYNGAVYDEQKRELLQQSHFYILPSYSEGFPTSVLEAMSYGLIPVITDGCNFPEVFERGNALKITPETSNICRSLDVCSNMEKDEIRRFSRKCQEFINDNYTLQHIAKLQFETLKKL